MNFFSDIVADIDRGLARMPSWAQDYFGGSVWEMFGYGGIQALAIGAIGWSIASWMERRHLKKLDLREQELRHITLTTAKRARESGRCDAVLLTGSSVIAHDYFRTLIISLRRLIGGNITPYERLVARGRRAAIIRLKQEAHIRGIDKVINIRFGASTLTGRPVRGVEIIAYGTGIKTIATS